MQKAGTKVPAFHHLSVSGVFIIRRSMVLVQVHSKSVLVLVHSRLALEHSKMLLVGIDYAASSSGDLRTVCTSSVRMDHSKQALEHSRLVQVHSKLVQVPEHNRQAQVHSSLVLEHNSSAQVHSKTIAS